MGAAGCGATTEAANAGAPARLGVVPKGCDCNGITVVLGEGSSNVVVVVVAEPCGAIET